MQQLLEQLTHDEFSVRYDAAQQLGKLGDPRAVDGLTARLNDENPKVKYAALSSLVKIGSTRAAIPTLTALLNDLDSRLWKLLTLDIGMRLRTGLLNMVEAGNTEAADLLISGLDNPDLNELQRALVIRLIGRTSDPRMTETFIDMLMIASDNLQAASAEALGYIGDVQAVEPLMNVLEDADSALREISMMSLAKLGDLRAVDVMLPMLAHDDEWTRRAAASALGELGDKRPVRQLLRMQREDSSQEVRVAAGEALTKLIMGNKNTDTPTDE